MLNCQFNYTQACKSYTSFSNVQPELRFKQLQNLGVHATQFRAISFYHSAFWCQLKSTAVLPTCSGNSRKRVSMAFVGLRPQRGQSPVEHKYKNPETVKEGKCGEKCHKTWKTDKTPRYVFFFPFTALNECIHGLMNGQWLKKMNAWKNKWMKRWMNEWMNE